MVSAQQLEIHSYWRAGGRSNEGCCRCKIALTVIFVALLPPQPLMNRCFGWKSCGSMEGPFLSQIPGCLPKLNTIHVSDTSSTSLCMIVACICPKPCMVPAFACHTNRSSDAPILHPSILSYCFRNSPSCFHFVDRDATPTSVGGG